MITEEGGLFKFEGVGGFEHFSLEFADGFGDIEVAAGFVDDHGGGILAGAALGVGGEAGLDGAADAFRGDIILAIVLELFFAAVLGDVEELLDALGLDIGVEDDLAMEMTGGAAGGLNQAGGAAEVAFLVGVEDGDEGNLGKIKAFAEEVDADEDVEVAFAQGAEDFDTFDGVDFAVEIADVNADIAQVIGEFLGSALGEGGDQDAFVLFDAFARLFDQIIDLAAEGFDGDFRVNEAGGADNQFGDLVLAPGQFPGPGSGAHVECLVLEGLEFIEAEGTVIEGAGEAETVIDEHGFAGEVAGVHAADLGHGGMGFVDDQQVILGEEIEQDMWA